MKQILLLGVFFGGIVHGMDKSEPYSRLYNASAESFISKTTSIPHDSIMSFLQRRVWIAALSERSTPKRNKDITQERLFLSYNEFTEDSTDKDINKLRMIYQDIHFDILYAIEYQEWMKNRVEIDETNLSYSKNFATTTLHRLQENARNKRIERQKKLPIKKRNREKKEEKTDYPKNKRHKS